VKKLESVGWIARSLANLQEFLSPNSYHERVEDSLIGTADDLVFWLNEPVKKNGEPYSEVHIQKKLTHYLRQYKANRVKLK